MTTTTTRATAVLEHRTAPLGATAAELRADGDAAPRFHGTAIVYDQRTAIGNPASWGWYEEIAPGCASKTLEESDVRFLVDHDTAKVVSRVSAGTLTLSDTATGLEVDSALNQAKSYVADLAENLADGSITGMSFGFYVVKDEWTREAVPVVVDGVESSIDVDVRRILEIRLVEVSAVTFPAYDQTDAGLRSMCDEVRSTFGATPQTPAPASGEDREPAAATRGVNDEPAAATRSDEVLHLRYRLRAKRDGHPLAGG